MRRAYKDHHLKVWLIHRFPNGQFQAFSNTVRFLKTRTDSRDTGWEEEKDTLFDARRTIPNNAVRLNHDIIGYGPVVEIWLEVPEWTTPPAID
jgi:hypothetical protein